jgi:DNA polymerase (family X)
VTRVPALSATLRQLADLSEIRGAASEAADLRRAAGAVDALGPDGESRLAHLARCDRLTELSAVPRSLHWKIRELVVGATTGAAGAARAGIPSLLRRLLDVDGFDTTRALALARVGILTSPELAVALDDGRIGRSLGGDVETVLRRAVGALVPDPRPGTLGRAWDFADSFVTTIAQRDARLQSATPAGDIRRFEPLVDGVVIVGWSTDPAASVESLCGTPGVEAVLHRTHRRAIVLWQGVEVDVRIAARDEFGTVLFHATGSRAHLAEMAARTGRRPALFAREEEVYRNAGLPWIPPELRQGVGEVQAASAGRLPPLVDRSHIRGDLHMHTTYSDGRDTLEAMLQEASTLAYEYVAITDHSERAAAARTVRADDLARQRDEIERLRPLYPSMVILHGVEVDILPNGKLDFPDRVLEPLDLVLASLHESAGHDARTLTRRCLAAIRHPLVNVITHPSNQYVGHRPGYDLDYEAVYRAAAETGTALEIDGGPAHLDLDGEHARAAVAAGATVTIDSDCHRARALGRQMQLGIGTARRGWVEPRHVLNARAIDEVRAFIAAKRRGRL